MKISEYPPPSPGSEVHVRPDKLEVVASLFPGYRCALYWGTAYPIDGRPQNEVHVIPDKLEVVASFCYLDDMLSTSKGCELAVTSCVKTAWKKLESYTSLTRVMAMCSVKLGC